MPLSRTGRLAHCGTVWKTSFGRKSIATIKGNQKHRLNHVLNVSFEGFDGDALIVTLGGVAVSAGSACNSHTREPSYVLCAMGLARIANRVTTRSPIRLGTDPGWLWMILGQIWGKRVFGNSPGNSSVPVRNQISSRGF
jgi:hypothetical protein